MSKKSAMVAIVGRPSAGKSTLMNQLCGEKISIVTPVPQTTRNRIRGILNGDGGQIVFLDTPGFHQSQRKYNRRLRNIMTESLGDCDLILYIIDSSRNAGEEEAELLDTLTGAKLPVIVAFNKTDIRNSETVRKQLSQRLPGAGAPALDISATAKTGLAELTRLLFELAPQGEAMYPEDFYTDQEPEFRISEIIRERAMLRARDELPHAIYVEIHDLEIKARESGTDQLWVRASIYVESKSQVGLVVGKKGEGIKAIRQESQKEIGRIFPYRVHLDLRVKTNPKWRRNETLLRKLVK